MTGYVAGPVSADHKHASLTHLEISNYSERRGFAAKFTCFSMAVGNDSGVSENYHTFDRARNQPVEYRTNLRLFAMTPVVLVSGATGIELDLEPLST